MQRRSKTDIIASFCFVVEKEGIRIRRSVMKKLVTLLLCLAMLVSLVACGSGKNKDSGKTFTFASELDINTLDSTVSDDGMSFNAMHATTDGLMGLDQNGNITCAIAESYTVSDDQLVYTYKLRDAKWSNGSK